MVNGNKVIDILGKVTEVISQNKDYLTELDAAIGDGDHGLNMDKGLKAVMSKLEAHDGNNIGDILRQAGMTLVSSVGGASGPLYGTAFMKGSMIVNNKSEIDINDFLNILKVALDGIKQRGHATEGEKTMIDALSPAVVELEKAIQDGDLDKSALNRAVNKAKEGVEFTKTIKATKGRASYLGDRSIGHADTGATSMYLILKTISEEV